MNFHMDFNFLLSLGFQALLCMKTVDVVKLGVGEMGSKRMDGTKMGNMEWHFSLWLQHTIYRKISIRSRVEASGMGRLP